MVTLLIIPNKVQIKASIRGQVEAIQKWQLQKGSKRGRIVTWVHQTKGQYRNSGIQKLPRSKRQPDTPAHIYTASIRQFSNTQQNSINWLFLSNKQWTPSLPSLTLNRVQGTVGATILSRTYARSLLLSRTISSR